MPVNLIEHLPPERLILSVKDQERREVEGTRVGMPHIVDKTGHCARHETVVKPPQSGLLPAIITA